MTNLSSYLKIVKIHKNKITCTSNLGVIKIIEWVIEIIYLNVSICSTNFSPPKSTQTLVTSRKHTSSSTPISQKIAGVTQFGIAPQGGHTCIVIMIKAGLHDKSMTSA